MGNDEIVQHRTDRIIQFHNELVEMLCPPEFTKEQKDRILDHYLAHLEAKLDREEGE